MDEKQQIREFQRKVEQTLFRHRSFLDVTSMLQESNARLTRSVMRAVTECGCIEIRASRQEYSKGLQNSIHKYRSHLYHNLCESCTDLVSTEMGKHLFYFTSLCSLLEIPLSQIFKQELKNLSTLGFFYLR
ncbi:hypothetical protein SAMN05444392_107141 [Seinonella peptonophila]|uniref:DUF1573 domain-containing protein n=1 Tax=Seinonella peptonophila TaxID=112248 RepID=A0A1M4YTL5_9BACL|nr:hypothetical protein [Seinonella peptonophila]SHF09189.1 hypothetical protein SAMN05444392_107141 [Seinonella peptonophila]